MLAPLSKNILNLDRSKAPHVLLIDDCAALEYKDLAPGSPHDFRLPNTSVFFSFSFSLIIIHVMSETKSKGDLRYIFSADKPTHTDLIDAVTSNVVYKVTPDYEGRKIVTKIRNASGDTIASLEWKDTLPDIVTYKQEPPRRVSSWLKPKSLLNPYEFAFFCLSPDSRSTWSIL